MIDIMKLCRAVFLLFCLMIPGFIMKKTRLADDRTPLAFSNTVLYITQPALLFVGFFRPYDKTIMNGAVAVFVFTFVVHAVFLLAVKLFFRNAPKETAKVYRFGSVFANAGYMGIPLMEMVLGKDAAVFASVYIIGFNFFAWSLGCLIYTGDKSYVSPKKMFINAATIPTFIGILLFVINAYAWLPIPVRDFTESALTMLKNTVAPMSMMVIGMRLADLKLKGAFKDKYMYLSFAMRLLVLPCTVFGLLWICSLLGFYNATAFTTVLICAATPSAALTGMFAEKFAPKPDPEKLLSGDEDAVNIQKTALLGSTTASKLVSLSTILSLLTMPLIAMLLKLLER